MPYNICRNLEWQVSPALPPIQETEVAPTCPPQLTPITQLLPPSNGRSARPWASCPASEGHTLSFPRHPPRWTPPPRAQNHLASAAVFGSPAQGRAAWGMRRTTSSFSRVSVGEQRERARHECSGFLACCRGSILLLPPPLPWPELATLLMASLLPPTPLACSRTVCIFNQICSNGHELFNLREGQTWECQLSVPRFAQLQEMLLAEPWGPMHGTGQGR